MEYRLIVMRHAKSDWESGAKKDHDRPLNKRGRRDAPRIAEKLVELGWQPNYVVSSDSQRTTETFQLMEEVFSDGTSVEFLDSLYLAGIRELEHAVGSVPNMQATVLALGHNPGWEDCVHKLTGECEEMTTANAALMTIEDEDWAAAIIRHGDWSLVSVLRPKEL